MKLRVLLAVIIISVFPSFGFGQTSSRLISNYLKAEVRGTLRKGEIMFFVESLDPIHPKFKINVMLNRTEDGNRRLTKFLEDNVGKEVVASGFINETRFSCEPFTIYLRIGVSGSSLKLVDENKTNPSKSSKPKVLQ
jgi:hypothetical protein